MRILSITGLIVAAVLPGSAQVCNPRKFQGAYGFQLSGSTTISGTKKPVASMGRLEFDGQGAVSGTSSVNFSGFLLGNPVTGTYEVRSNCAITWNLQDDSGGWQHFSGTLSPDLEHGTFQQTDPGGAQRGALAKTAPVCSESAIRGTYDFSISGSTIAMSPGQSAGNVSMEGILAADGAGNLTRLDRGAATPVGTLTVDSECIVNIDLTPSGEPEMKLRGVLVNGGREILAIETDPGAAVNARLRAHPRESR